MSPGAIVSLASAARHDRIAGLKDFQVEIASEIEDPANVKHVARRFGVSHPTVIRWASGVSRPYPTIAQMILRWLENDREARKKP